MKTVWKWILAILVLILVVGAFGTAAYFWSTHRGLAFANNMPSRQGWNGGPMMRGDGSQAGPMMRGYDFRWQSGPMMRGGRGFGGFFMLGGLGWLVRLAFFGLLLYGAYWLGRRNARVVVDPRTPAAAAPVSPAPPAPEPPADEIPPAS